MHVLFYPPCEKEELVRKKIVVSFHYCSTTRPATLVLLILMAASRENRIYVVHLFHGKRITSGSSVWYFELIKHVCMVFILEKPPYNFLFFHLN